MPGSCSKGFMPCPSAGTGQARKNGLDVNSKNAKKPTPISPITPSTRARCTRLAPRVRHATANVQPASTHTHSSMEPSWLPHTAV